MRALGFARLAPLSKSVEQFDAPLFAQCVQAYQLLGKRLASQLLLRPFRQVPWSVRSMRRIPGASLAPRMKVGLGTIVPMYSCRNERKISDRHMAPKVGQDSHIRNRHIRKDYFAKIRVPHCVVVPDFACKKDGAEENTNPVVLLKVDSSRRQAADIDLCCKVACMHKL